MLFQYLFLLVTLAAAKELVTSNLCELKSFFFSKKKVVDIDLDNRVSHLQFFLISLLFQAGIYARHTKEQEKYRSYMFYVSIFQRFWTFVLNNYAFIAFSNKIITNLKK